MTPVAIYMGVGLAWALSYLAIVYMPQIPDGETRKARDAFAAHPLLSLTLLLFVCIFFWPGIFLADLKKGFSR